MALVNLRTVLEAADKGKYAVGNFDIFNVEMLNGVLAAAEETRSPIILAFGEGFESHAALENFAPLLLSAAKKATVPVVVHLDHAVNVNYLIRAVHAGFTSVMIDASDKPFAENVAATRRVVELCKPLNVSVEAELGHVSGLGSLYQSDDAIYTDVGEATEFVEKTGIDALAVAIGTVHGVYKEEPRLNLQRLREIKASVGLPLVLHGGSGLSVEDFQNTIKYGVAKINIFTDLTIAAMDALRSGVSDPAANYRKLCGLATQAVKAEAIKKMKIFGSCGKAV